MTLVVADRRAALGRRLGDARRAPCRSHRGAVEVCGEADRLAGNEQCPQLGRQVGGGNDETPHMAAARPSPATRASTSVTCTSTSRLRGRSASWPSSGTGQQRPDSAASGRERDGFGDVVVGEVVGRDDPRHVDASCPRGDTPRRSTRCRTQSEPKTAGRIATSRPTRCAPTARRSPSSTNPAPVATPRDATLSSLTIATTASMVEMLEAPRRCERHRRRGHTASPVRREHDVGEIGAPVVADPQLDATREHGATLDPDAPLPNGSRGRCQPARQRSIAATTSSIVAAGISNHRSCSSSSPASHAAASDTSSARSVTFSLVNVGACPIPLTPHTVVRGSHRMWLFSLSTFWVTVLLVAVIGGFTAARRRPRSTRPFPPRRQMSSRSVSCREPCSASSVSCSPSG